MRAAYSPVVSTPQRRLASAAGIEAALLTYAALVAFLTPTRAHEHNTAAAMVLLMLAAPLYWYLADNIRSRDHTDLLALRVLIPNVVLLVMCLNGALVGARARESLLAGMIACALLTMAVAALRLGRSRLRSTARITSL